jgi:hypothetical protein
VLGSPGNQGARTFSRPKVTQSPCCYRPSSPNQSQYKLLLLLHPSQLLPMTKLCKLSSAATQLKSLRSMFGEGFGPPEPNKAVVILHEVYLMSFSNGPGWLAQLLD